MTVIFVQFKKKKKKSSLIYRKHLDKFYSSSHTKPVSYVLLVMRLIIPDCHYNTEEINRFNTISKVLKIMIFRLKVV